MVLLLCLSGTQAAFSTGHGISKQQAVEIARQANPGKVLSVKHDADSYRIKILNERGEVRVISIDAKSGKVVSR